MLFMPSRRSFLTAAGAIGASALARPSRATGAGPAAFRDDAALLKRAYGALHPGLYRYNSPARIEALFAGSSTDLSTAPSLSHAYLGFARITAAVRCGHSYPNFYNQSDAIHAALFDGRDKLPLLFRWIGERMIVTRDLSSNGIAPGTEVRAIEGMDAHRLLRGLLPYARADGHNDAKRRRILEVEGIDRYQAFDTYAPMLWPAMFARGAARLVLRQPDGTASNVDVRLMTLTERLAASPSIDDKPADAVLWSMERKPGGIACLTMPSWSVYNGTWDWRGWLEARLDEIASEGTRALIVDLRGNEGGLDCGNPILARLVDRDVPSVPNARRVRARKVPDDIRPHVRTWDKSFYDWGADAQGPRADGFYDLAGEKDPAKNGMTIRPAGKRFRGKVLVLIDSSNSSATFGFAEFVRNNGLATLVGEATGGNRRGINGGAFLFLTLPATGIEVDIPLIGYFPAGPQPDAGILPDLGAVQTPGDIAAGFDRAMAVAIRAAGWGNGA